MTDEPAIRQALEAETPAQAIAAEMRKKALARVFELEAKLSAAKRHAGFCAYLIELLALDPHADELTLFLLQNPTGNPLAGASARLPEVADVAGADALRQAAPASPSPESVAMTAADTSALGVPPGACGAEVFLPDDTNTGHGPIGSDRPEGYSPETDAPPAALAQRLVDRLLTSDMSPKDGGIWAWKHGLGQDANPWPAKSVPHAKWEEWRQKSAKERVE